MPVYNVLCDNGLKGCGLEFTTECLMKNLEKHFGNLVCPNCKQNHTLHQVYSPPIVHIPKTLGSLADKNNHNFSSDYKEKLNKEHNEYKNKKGWVCEDGKIKHINQLKIEENNPKKKKTVTKGRKNKSIKKGKTK